jgi:hypothetical protein
VNLRLEGKPDLVARGRAERPVAQVLEALVPEEARLAMSEYGTFRVTEFWHWRPIGNESLTVGLGCAGVKGTRRCGAVVARLEQGNNEALAWVEAGRFPPGVRVFDDARTLYVYGLDRMSSFRQGVVFEWGRVRLGDVERKLGPGGWRTSSVSCCR